MLSFLAFSSLGGGNLNPSGGGPSVEPPATLDLRVLVEKAAGAKALRPVAARKEDVGRDRASAVNARGEDIVSTADASGCRWWKTTLLPESTFTDLTFV